MRIFYISQFVKPGRREDILAYSEIHIEKFYINKNWEFVALRYEFPILAGAQGHELPDNCAFFNHC